MPALQSFKFFLCVRVKNETIAIVNRSVFLTASPLSAFEIKVTSGKYSNYYHFQYKLCLEHYEINKKCGFNPGGQFEVFVTWKK